MVELDRIVPQPRSALLDQLERREPPRGAAAMPGEQSRLLDADGVYASWLAWVDDGGADLTTDELWPVADPEPDE